MNYSDFKNYFQKFPLINSIDIVNKGNSQTMYNQINNWLKKGLLVKLKKGLYILNSSDRKIEITNYFLANQLYSPSYVSLEYALSLYGIIPEAVISVTSVTTKKTKKIKNDLGLFTYRHIKKDAFRGFKEAKDNKGLNYFLADPEKAVVDFIYLNLHKFSKEDKNIFENSYRFQNLQILRPKKLITYAKLFNNQKLDCVVKNLYKICKG